MFGNPALSLQQATQYSLSGEWSPLSSFGLDLTLFYKDIANLTSPTGNTVERDGQQVSEVYNNGGTGRAFGAEVFIKRSIANGLSGWERAGDTWTLSTYLSLVNATNRVNVEANQYSFDYSEQAGVRGIPILPILGLKGSW